MTVSIALYQPDIAGNTGTLLRLGACMGVSIEIIEPAGFDLSDRNLKRAGMDYLDQAALVRHLDFAAFEAARQESGRRLVLLSTRADCTYLDFNYQEDDILLFGRESAGVPESVHLTADARLTIPMQTGARSLNLAISASMVLGEALRQTRHATHLEGSNRNAR
ncbi:tRNA (cytidine(34)-2'-O)-methyltransferase [Aureimonas fodinaquatilis]|uniref:tRNA (cytidine(34)-2'-O)-methyltransferase n=1 Tax=Aureimonas fodinaquatilis TaxID=2565783 RepID=A0A5B0E0W7_9HYPH|nr:tRNA (cytidine(34)-2'-O)-methyltransferase [Aureimonas fodinaquatilis]KAA0971765.1 tRNA (cytidine(34)-2'-O)-methyltransferase [Aureimonas fodinaquatilis]